MATLALDFFCRRSAKARALFLADIPGRLEFAWRLAMVCTISAAIAEWFQIPEVALTAYVGFFLIKSDRTSSIATGLAMLIAASMLIGLVALLANVVIGRPGLLLLVMIFIAFGALFLTSSSKLQPVGGILALIATFALSLIGLLPEGELATRALLYAWLMVTVPVGVSTIVNLLIGPAPKRLVTEALSQRLLASAALLRAAKVNAGDLDGARNSLITLRDEGTDAIEGWLRMAKLERSCAAEDVLALQHASDSTTYIMWLVQALDQLHEETGSTNIAYRDQLASMLEQMASILARNGYPIDIDTSTLTMTEANELSDSSISSDHTATKEDDIYVAFRNVLAHFADAEPRPHTSEEQREFFVIDAFRNPTHVRFALKATAAAMFCYVLYNVLGWQGIHTAFITCFIVALGTTAETVEKLTLRIAGCLLGAILGIISLLWVIPHLQGLGGLLILLLPVTMLATWIAAGSPRIAYIGFQLAFAFYLCVLQGNGPADDLTVARDRVIGILIGNAVVYLMFTSFWPVSIAKRIDPALAVLLRHLSAIAQSPQSRTAWIAAGKANEESSRITSELALLAYEPTRLRPDTAWIRQRQHTLDCANRLSISLTALHEAKPVTRTLEALAEQLEQSSELSVRLQSNLQTIPATVRQHLRALVAAVENHTYLER